jgi:hypothetical protein
MSHKYIIVNQCLQLLKQSNLPTIKKLLVEIKLIQMKRLLLDEDVPSTSTCGYCGENVFEALLCQMRRISGGDYEGETLTDLMERMSGMLMVLGEQEQYQHAH